MCGRYNVTSDPLAELFLEIAGVPFVGEDRWNLAPTEFAPVFVRNEDIIEVRDMRWWLVPWWSKEARSKYAMFNARSESIETSNAFKEPFKSRRCAVPASGFYEWVREGTSKQPMYMRGENQKGLVFAGIHDRWRSPEDGTTLESFAIVTTVAHPSLSFVHSRQPVFLNDQRLATWLDPNTDPAELRALMQPAIPIPIEALPVSTFVNNARNKDPRCAQPLGPGVLVPGSEEPTD